MAEFLRLHRMACGIRNLGAGVRVVVWTQGCNFNCPGCCSVKSHALHGGVIQSVDIWIKIIDDILGGAVPDGLTISGGEPTLQANAVSYLISALRLRYAGIDVMLYTGQFWSRLQEDYVDLITKCDVVISERYVADIPPQSYLHGSGNQTIHLLTPLAQRRYKAFLSENELKPLSVTSVSGQQISAVGIPSQLQLLSKALAKRGIQLINPSWRM